MPLAAGTRLGPYEISAPLGSGGMGEVYRARDTRLGREVAIKILPASLAGSPETRARFEREAQTISSLHHPNICVLFDVGRDGEVDYLVMELLEGETLAQRIARGALPTADVLRIGGQIADALDRAHRAGVTHRDLKPGNVMLTKSGAKLLDFGLARSTGLAGPDGSGATTTQSPTMGAPLSAPLTEKGSIVGTYQYMAPEQLEGKEADARSDLWAFGCVLYEMATGKRAFEGATQASLISAIMRDQPRAMSQLAPMSPPALERVVEALLAKDPEERWQSAADVRRELEWTASGVSESGTPARRAPQRRARIAVVAWATLAILAMIYAFAISRAKAPTPPLVRFSIPSPPGTVINSPAEAQLSPDGRTIVFVALDSALTLRLYLRSLASLETRAIPGTENARMPFWSPDGRMLGFFANAKLRRVTLDGSPPVDLCDAPDPRGGAWSPEGTIVFAPNNQGSLARIPANGGAPVAITALDTARHERGHRYPQFLPDGRHYLYVAVGAGDEVSTLATSLEGGKPVEVCRAGSMARHAPPGYLLYLDAGVNAPRRKLLARRFDPRSLRASGDARLVLDDVSARNLGDANLSSLGGALVVQHLGIRRGRLLWRDRYGAQAGVADEDFVGDGCALSPDASRIAYSGFNPRDLFVRDLKTGVSTRLTFENQQVNSIIWAPDGRRLAYARLLGSYGYEVRMIAADGTSGDSLLFRGPGMFSYPQSWSEDGRWLLITCSDPEGNFDLWRVPMTGEGKPEIYQKTAGQERAASFSPDGAWVVYGAEEDGGTNLYVQSFPEPHAKYQVASAGDGAVWNLRGDALLSGDPSGQVYETPVSTANGFRQGATRRVFRLQKGEQFMDVDRRGQRILVYSVKDFSASSSLEVVLGWSQLLEKR